MLNDAIKKAILEHAAQCYPRESCGLIVDDAYLPCTNIAADDEQFEIDPSDYIKCSLLGEIKAVVHSHPDSSINPSQPDKVQMNLPLVLSKKAGLEHLASQSIPWVITNGTEIAVFEPDGYQAPLLGREYHHGLLDCYTLFKDYYERELGIMLSEYERKDAWWEDSNHSSLYLDNYQREGFVEVSKDELQKHDVLLCRVGRTNHVNRAAIFLGDGKLTSEEAPPVFGDSIILHHPYGCDSLREIFGRQWYDRTAIVIRHKSLIRP